jgi:DNA transposition AAA+ family ATPase
MGFSPTGYAEVQRRTSLAAKIDGALTDKMNRLRKRYRIALSMGDMEALDEAMKDIRDWNATEAQKDAKLLITMESLRRSVDSANRLRKTMDGGYTPRFPRYIEQATN